MMFGKNKNSSKKPYKICVNCIMDTSDPTITFDDKGICHFCNNFFTNIQPNWFPNEKGEKILMPLINKIKQEGKSKDHDCIIGISGGLDSSYVAYVAKEKFGLRPLLFHCDAGWNSDISTSNIEKIVDKLNLDLYTEVIDWPQMKELQKAFFKSQVSFVDTPQDSVLFSSLYNYANKHKFKYVITGGNFSTEVVRECLDWTYFAHDTRHIKDIFKIFGEGKIDKLPMCDIFKYKFYYRFVKGIRVIKMLDYTEFKRDDAIRTLKNKFNWLPYQQKHYESRFTKFYESYWTPKKFGFDKRRVYLSSMILSNQISRKEAEKKINKNELSEIEMENDFNYVARKLDWSKQELKAIFNADNKSFRDYKNNYFWIKLGAELSNILKIDNRIFR